jgi:hypothetical protein
MCEGVSLSYLAQCTDQWRDLPKMVINFMISMKAGNFLTR